MQNNYMINIDWDTVDKIVIDQLRNALDNMRRDYESGMRIFSNDENEDSKMIKKHIKAVKLILAYYGVDNA